MPQNQGIDVRDAAPWSSPMKHTMGFHDNSKFWGPGHSAGGLKEFVVLLEPTQNFPTLHAGLLAFGGTSIQQTGPKETRSAKNISSCKVLAWASVMLAI